MALSTDPEKRERQMAGLRIGQQVLARRILGITDDDATASQGDTSAKASQGAAPAKARAKAKPATRQGDHDVLRYPERKDPPDAPEDHDADESGRADARRDSAARRPGFIDGILGRI